ncbi:hypothetical protein [Leptothoe sp. PORK10 BA2]|uniref:hypothetical protein n=1 Tax=Leptothoe sp. PORK10 BA2 TaxID=3110254 RepID=UPI002B200FD0|nr:hypothetical protein [Leptothoe sp. PORK10 BA2]MEA5464890.1 hypothetical protein [Leptothoe sp. PORK10 BA2]
MHSPTLLGLELSAPAGENRLDADEIYSFDVEPGDAISINVKTSPDNPIPSCIPEFISGPRLDLTLADYITQTPYSDSVVVQFTEQDAGHYRYRIVPSPQIELLGEEDVPEASLPSDNPADERWCQVTVQPASATEQLWAIANRLYDQGEDLEQALDLYSQVIATEPEYPEPYERYFYLMMNLNSGNLSISSDEDPVIMGQKVQQWFMTLPDAVQSPILEMAEQLAQLYEANPSWQLEATDHPDFWRGYASYLQTGVASESVSNVLFP